MILTGILSMITLLRVSLMQEKEELIFNGEGSISRSCNI